MALFSAALSARSALNTPLLRHQLLSQPKAAPVQFQGRDEFRKEQESLVEDLKKAGITKETLKEKWNVVLWFVRDQGDRVRLLIESKGKGFDMEAFQNWFAETLKPVRPNQDFDVKAKEHPVDRCCHKQCDGCLAGSKAHKKDWVK